MTEAIEALVSAAKNTKFTTISSNLTDEDVSSVWDNVSAFVEKQMAQQKGVNIPGLGTFTYSQKKLDVGNNKFILIQRPIFALSEKFAQTHGLHHTKRHISGKIPVVQLNFASLSHDSVFDRDTVEACVKEVLGALQRSIAAKKNVEFTFNGIGKLLIRDSIVKMKFYKEFINIMDGSGRLADSMQDRPGTLDSVMTNRNTPIRPNTSQTLILPRINPSASAPDDGLKTVRLEPENMSVIHEEHEAANQSLKSVTTMPQETTQNETQEDAKEADDCKKSAVTIARSVAVQAVKPICISFQDDQMSDGMNTPKGPRRKAVIPSSPQPRRYLSPLNALRGPLTTLRDPRTRSYDAALRRSQPPGKIPSVISPDRPITPGTCGHLNAGQELCYICHQRARRNIPIYFSEERKQQDQEQDEVLQKYQHAKDVESILIEQDLLVDARRRTEKVALCNLSIAQNVRLNTTVKDPTFHPSCIFQNRPLTPPKYPKQSIYMEDLKEQMDIKVRREKRRKADEAFLGRLEQVQLAEDLVAQREMYLQEKKHQKEQYRRALFTQLRYKPVPLPARVPDSDTVIFGKNDLNPARIMRQREGAYELYQDQLANVEQKKRQALLRKMQDQQEEEVVLAKTKEEMISDRADKYVRNFNNRKNVETNWFDALCSKKAREVEEIDHRGRGADLVHEQCDKYKRCDGCQRGFPNSGETNIWKESRYISGSRLMI